MAPSADQRKSLIAMQNQAQTLLGRVKSLKSPFIILKPLMLRYNQF